jgi:hypothetical protein
MPRDEDAFWDELGVSWRASIRDPALVSSRLETRLKLQSALLTAGRSAAISLGVLGFGLAAWTLWIGWTGQVWNFITRGITVAAISLLAILASLALRARDRLETRSLQESLRLSITRSERLIRATDLACYSLVILAVGGMIGYALRTRFGRPPAVPPVEDLLVLSVAGLALLWFRRSQARALRRHQHILKAFRSGDELE